MLCWDGSRAATRAIADAMPLLKKAGQVEVVIVTNERGKRDEIEGADMAQHLARHGLKVEVKRTVLGDIAVADVILSHAADVGSDFIVMGGYGHSRLREFVLGGVTRSILHVHDGPGADVALSCRVSLHRGITSAQNIPRAHTLTREQWACHVFVAPVPLTASDLPAMGSNRCDAARRQNKENEDKPAEE